MPSPPSTHVLDRLLVLERDRVTDMHRANFLDATTLTPEEVVERRLGAVWGIEG